MITSLIKTIKSKLKHSVNTRGFSSEQKKASVITEVKKNKVHYVQHDTLFYGDVQINIMNQIYKHFEDGQATKSSKRKDNEDTINFSLFIRHPADVLMSHGAADKNYMLIKTNKSTYHANKFKHIFVPGPWLKNRLLNDDAITLTEDQIHCVGWPRLDLLRRRRNNFLVKLEKKPRKKKHVLWAPTHDFAQPGQNIKSTSTHPGLLENTPDLKLKYAFKESLHPRNRGAKKDGFDKTTTIDMLCKADIVISDNGTMVYEAWGLGIPVIFPRWILGNTIIDVTPGSAEAYIFENNIGLHPNSYEEMCEMIETEQEIGQDVKDFMEEYMPSEYLGKSGKRIAHLLSTLKK